MSRSGSQSEPNGARFQLNALVVGGFKSIRNRTSLELGQLTLLAGANSSGKSAIVQPFLLLKQTLESAYDVGPLRIQGDNIHFKDASQAFSRPAANLDNPILEIGFNTSSSVASLYFRIEGQQVILDRWVEFDAQGSVIREISPGMETDALQAAFANELRERWGLKLGMKVDLAYRQSRCIPAVQCHLQQTQTASMVFFLSPWFLLEGVLAGLIHVPAVRAIPGQASELVRIHDSYVPVIASLFEKADGMGEPPHSMSSGLARKFGVFPGRFDRYVASLVLEWQTTDPVRFQQLESMLMALGLSSCITVAVSGFNNAEVNVSRVARDQRHQTDDLVNISQAGQAIQHVLPVLVALVVAEPGHCIYIEQPELHLHPRAQADLAPYLLEAAKRGAILIVETHSNLILTGIQEQIAKGAYAPELVRLHWFKQGEDGVTRIDTVTPNERGALGDCPVDFSDVELDVEGRYIRAAASRAS